MTVRLPHGFFVRIHISTAFQLLYNIHRKSFLIFSFTIYYHFLYLSLSIYVNLLYCFYLSICVCFWLLSFHDSLKPFTICFSWTALKYLFMSNFAFLTKILKDLVLFCALNSLISIKPYPCYFRDAYLD